MEEKWETRIKKLALAYRTGWQYRPGTDEAGSVLTDIFLEMERENQKRYRKMFEKHRCRFLSAVPKPHKEEKRLKTALCVKASEKSNGAQLPEGTEIYNVPAEGGLIWFRTVSPLKLTTARLCCAVYRNGFWAWRTDMPGEEKAPLALFLPRGEEIARPDFRWYFRGLCDGQEKFRFGIKFQEAGEVLPELKGEWSIRRGETVVCLKWQQGEEGITLSGECQKFGNYLDFGVYELCFCAKEELGRAWLAALYGGFALEEAPKESEPKFCLTDEGRCGAKRVLPFGRTPGEASCCYLVCDQVAAGRNGRITLQFTQRFEKEERLAAQMPAEYKKIWKKYPWMRQTEEVLDWSAKESVWEYFNGNFWCVLPGSEAWATGCYPGSSVLTAGGSLDGGAKKTVYFAEGGAEGFLGEEQVYHFEKPEDMQSCIVEGEEHFFIRLRLVHVQNAYAAYYRKYIPVMENIRFLAGERRIEMEGCKLPAREWAGEKKMYLGFDKEITPENRWYTGEGWCSFSQEQINGWENRFGRNAFWVELAEEEAKVLTSFCPNYVEVLQVLPDENQDGEEEIPEKIPASSMYFVDTRDFGVLEAVSLVDAAAGMEPGMLADTVHGDNIPISGVGNGMHGMEEEMSYTVGEPIFAASKIQDAGNYFSHYGRLITQMDLKIYMRERFPQLRLVSCSYMQDDREFFVAVQAGAGMRGAKELLPELEAWLTNLLSKVGGMWFQGAFVRCSLAESEKKQENGAES